MSPHSIPAIRSLIRRLRFPAGCVLAGVLLALPAGLLGHEASGHHGPTYEVTTPIELSAGQKRLRLQVLDAATGRPAAARFSLEVDGHDYVPEGLDAGGLRFVSIHSGKQQRIAFTFARGTGPVEIPLPAGAGRVRIFLVKGFEFEPGEQTIEARGMLSEATFTLRRWSDVQARGWMPVEEHVHYDRLDPKYDRDWLTLLAADDIVQAHFMMLKGYNLPGVWASQFAYGPAGEATGDGRLIRPGEEYRDNLQGHINLLGVTEVVEPVLTGMADHPENWPPFLDVLTRARAVGGVVGPAHGADLGLSSTGLADTILGRSDFFEIANTNRYALDNWYHLLNCGYIVPPVAGTDLPNFPSRAPWQPLLGEVRTYVKTGGDVSFAAFKTAIARGETFVTSGPMIAFSVAGVGPGGLVRLPAGGGDVTVEAELSSPRQLQQFEIVRQGEVLGLEIVKRQEAGINVWRIRARVRIEHSAWLAARGLGELKPALLAESGIRQNTLAHTAPVRVLVGEEPIASAADTEFLLRRLENQAALYRATGKFSRPEDRAHSAAIFEQAIRELEARR